MSVFQKTIERQTDGRGTYSFSDDVQAIVAQSGVAVGICQVFVHHTSASLILSENADPDVQRDLETFMSRLVPDGDPIYRHTMEGPDDMPAHVRAMLTQSAISLPVREGRCDLGTWQGIYLWEHRHAGYQRRVTVTVIGD
jgi:secondary thiamine-phosphate synthase enzyme